MIRVSKRRDVVTKSAARKPSPPAQDSPRQSLGRLRLYLALGAFVTLGPLLIIRAMDIPLGQGSFFYRFSTLYGVRAIRGLPFLVLALALAWSVRLTARRAAPGLLACGLVALCLAIWTFLAVPKPGSQRMFDFMSPAHDGAFVLERETQIENPGDLTIYLRHFNERLRSSTEKMLGTRVLSNPPGTTIVAALSRDFWPPEVNPPGWIERQLGNVDVLVDRPIMAEAVRFAIVLQLIWLLSAVPIFCAAPLPVAGGRCCRDGDDLVCIDAMLFAPGKDPAQLFTVGLMAWSILASFKARSTINAVSYSAIFGVALVAGLTMGLIHFWVAFALAAFTLWEASTQRGLLGIRDALRRQGSPAIISSTVFIAAVYLGCGWNIPSTLLAVATRFNEIQPTLNLNHGLWMFIGLPIFLMFVSPSLYAVAAINVRRFGAAYRLERGCSSARSLQWH